MLRVARERQGMDLAALAFLLKVPVQQLQALEDDRYDVFRGPTFVRAVAQAVCRHVGIDPAPVLAALPQTSHALPARPPAGGRGLHARRRQAGRGYFAGAPFSRWPKTLRVFSTFGRETPMM